MVIGSFGDYSGDYRPFFRIEKPPNDGGGSRFSGFLQRAGNRVRGAAVGVNQGMGVNVKGGAGL